MTKRLQSLRLQSSQFISTGPEKINSLEEDIADLMGYELDTLYDSTPWTIDSDGNIGVRSDGAFPRLISTGGPALAFFDDDAVTPKEALTRVQDGYFYILENVGTPGGTQTLRKRMVVELTGDGADEPGQDILNHKRIPDTMGAEGEYLAVSSGGELVFTAPGGEPVVPGCSLIRQASYTVVNGATWGTLGLATLTFLQQFSTGSLWTGGNDYLEVGTSGIYYVSIAAKFEDSNTISPLAGLAWGKVAGTPIRSVVRDTNVLNTATFSMTHSCVYNFAEGDKIYLMARAYGGSGNVDFFDIEISAARIGAAS